MIKNLIITIAFMFAVPAAFCQLESELNFIMEKNPLVQSKPHQRPPISFKDPSERKLFVMGLIRFYQLFISSQQNNIRVCTFTPGCSDFGLAAIKNYGAFYGTLMAADRIQRCHNYKRRFYPIHSPTGKRYDPIEPYYRKLKLK